MTTFQLNVRQTSCSRLVDCLQRDDARDPEITWSHVWLSWLDPASRFMHVEVFLIQSASLDQEGPSEEFDGPYQHAYLCLAMLHTWILEY